jgi:parvulin-like peptidyl-prolyl isomerase
LRATSVPRLSDLRFHGRSLSVFTMRDLPGAGCCLRTPISLSRVSDLIIIRWPSLCVRLCVVGWIAFCILLGCKSRQGQPANVVGRYSGGTVTSDELQREVNRMPPALRQQFETPNGRREMVAAMIDKRLLALEAERRGLRNDPEIKRQVSELEERLAIQSLLAAEERAAGAASEADARAWYDAHRGELAQPERVRVSRILVAVAHNATPAERTKAKARADRLAAQVRKTNNFSKAAAEGDGPEKAHGGDTGLIAKGSRSDKRFEAAAFSLAKPGAVSPVVECDDGYAILQLMERREGRIPSFEETRSEVENRLAPQRKRKVFDDLIAKLRHGGEVWVGAEAAAPQ